MNQENIEKGKTGTVLCVIALVAAAYNLIASHFYSGILNITYFTALSNLMVLIVSAMELMKFKTDKPWYKYFMFVTAVAITVTFLVYLLILAPTSSKGFIGAYQKAWCGSFTGHIVSPICYVIYFMLYDKNELNKKEITLGSIAFPTFYLIFSLILSALGVKWGRDIKMAMPYNFMNYDAPCGWFGIRPDTINSGTLGIGVAYMLVVLLILFLLVGKGLYALKKKVQKQ
ncbi:MAG: hypothetical protein K6G03_11905 [Lachnospiraceae bacterium]|nr:hypothetical protein [Lachnospiraceae bacterium]